MANGETAPSVLVQEIDDAIKRIQQHDDEALANAVVLLLRCQRVTFRCQLQRHAIGAAVAALTAGIVSGVTIGLFGP